jgi:hypothetical protein
MQTLTYNEFETTRAFRQLSSQQRDDLQHWFEGSVTTTFVVLDEELIQIWDKNVDRLHFEFTTIMAQCYDGGWQVGTREANEKPTNQTQPHFRGTFKECIEEIDRLADFSFEEVN